MALQPQTDCRQRGETQLQLSAVTPLCVYCFFLLEKKHPVAIEARDPSSLIWSSRLPPDSCSTEKISKELNVISVRSVSFISFILCLNLLPRFITAHPLSSSVLLFSVCCCFLSRFVLTYKCTLCSIISHLGTLSTCGLRAYSTQPTPSLMQALGSAGVPEVVPGRESRSRDGGG